MSLKGFLFGAASSLIVAFSAHAQSISPESHIAVAPDLAVNERGEIALLWVDRAPEEKQAQANHDNHLSYTDLYVAISRDGGATFGAPTKINQEAGVVWGQTVSRPRIVGSTKGTWHVSYSANETHPTMGKIALTTHYTRSVDGGSSFEPARRLSTLTDSDLSEIIHGGFMSAAAFGAMTATPDGGVHVMWIDTRMMKSETDTGALYTAVSRDDGKTFTTDKALFENGVCPCCQLTAITDKQSNILLSSRQIAKDGARQSTIARIGAGSETAAKPIETGGAPWLINACPLKPTVMTMQGDAVFSAVYNGGEEKPSVFFSVSTDGGNTFARAVSVHPDALVSDAPSIATNDRFVMVAWHGKTTGPRRVFYRMYDLKGQPVGEITELPTGPENAQTPMVVARADGKFQIAWQQSDRVFTTTLPAAPTKLASAGN